MSVDPRDPMFHDVLKHGIMASFPSISEHSAMGVEDAERARRMVKNTIGRRLTYRQPNDLRPSKA